MPASTHPLCFLLFRPHAVSLAVRKDAARRRDILSRVNIVKRIKIGGRWKMFSIPRNAKGNYDWNAIADGRYYVEWYAGAKRAKLDPTKFDLKTFRSTYATGMLRRGFDVRTVQHWMGHKSLETTMRYLAPATDVHDEVDLVTIPSVGKADPAPRKSAARESRSSRKARS